MNSKEHPSEAPAATESSDVDTDVETGVDADNDHTDTPTEDALTFSGSVAIETTTDDLWATISDPATLTECVPGAESIERVDERTYTVEITRGVSHLTVSLSGEAEFVEMNPPAYVVTSASAFDSKTGSDFDILAAMEISETDAGAALAYTAEVSISGGVGSMSPRLLRPIVNRDIETYFENVKSEVEGQ